MALMLAEAAAAKNTSRQAIWLAINRGALTARMTSGGMWLIEEDDKWRAFTPRKYLERRPGKTVQSEGE